ncbi:MAG: hypothetical protein KC777_29790 [Cyanobacteria bacterium HKST-UBA02]|nr:hypothetical protein [Cyanobacteria bacterium HKST-UBA02]
MTHLEDNSPLLKERIAVYHRRKVVPKALPSPKLARVAAEVARQVSAPSREPSSFELGAIEAKFRDAVETNDWSKISVQDWRLAAYILWFEKPYLATIEGFLNRYLDWLDSTKLASGWRKLIYVYLKNFEYHWEFPYVYRKLARGISAGLEIEQLQKRLFQWRDRNEFFKMFSEDFDVSKTASCFSHFAHCDWKRFSQLTGLDGELAQVGYVQDVAIEILNDRTNDESTALDVVREFHIDDGNLRFAKLRKEVIEKVLASWTNGNGLGEDRRQWVQGWLLDSFGDPRLAVHRQDGWRGVSEDSVQVVYRWLAGDSLDQFFAIIDQYGIAHQWEYRKAFWKAYYDKGLLSEAWVALGSDAWEYARDAFGKNFSAGKLERSNYGDNNKQSVLILRIDSLVIVEWSHNGKCRAWKAKDTLAPQMYKSNYERSDLNNKSLQIVPHVKYEGISHLHSEKYSWQRKLSDFIYNETGVRVQESDFRI